MHNYIFTPTGEVWPAASVISRIDDVEGMPANVWLDANKPVEQMTWAPGLPMIIRDRLISEGGWIDRRGVSCFNLYRPPTVIPGDAAQAGKWIDHVHTIYPDDAEHTIAYLAHRRQQPEDKINHALVMGGAQGIGKDTILEPIKYAVGPWNFREVSPQHMLDERTDFVKSVVLRISEVRDLGEYDRFKFYYHMKVYTAAPPDVLRCNEKHLRQYSVPNCCGVILTTNDKVGGIYLAPDDRRNYVAWSDSRREDFEEEYWNDIYRWYHEEDGIEHVVAYLDAYDLSDFDAKAPPSKTAAFWEIVDAGRVPENAELADAIDALGETTVLDQVRRPDAVTIEQVREISRDEGLREFLSDRKTARQVPHRFEECGYVAVQNPGDNEGLWKINGRRMRIYARAELTVPQRQAAAEALRDSLNKPGR